MRGRRHLTGAGVSAGVDTALQLAATLTNNEVARMVQLAIKYDPHPPHGPLTCAFCRPAARPRHFS